MRRALALMLLVLVLPSTAGAQRRASVSVPGAAVALRGTVEAATPAEAPAAPLQIQSLLPPVGPPDPPVGGEAGQCRLACAQSYYFCLSSDGADDCAPTWGQCRARCDAPSASQSIASR